MKSNYCEVSSIISHDARNTQQNIKKKYRKPYNHETKTSRQTVDWSLLKIEKLKKKIENRFLWLRPLK